MALISLGHIEKPSSAVQWLRLVSPHLLFQDHTMALLDILIYPDQRLRQRAIAVDEVDAGILNLIDDMIETMYHASGIGLAAVQINVARRIVVIDLSETQNELRVFINPEIIEQSGSQLHEEGCLSVPGIFAEIGRAEIIKINYLNRNGKQMTEEADEMLAVCLQHEIDHLDGKVFVDRLSRLKQERIKKRLLKEAKQSTNNA